MKSLLFSEFVSNRYATQSMNRVRRGVFGRMFSHIQFISVALSSVPSRCFSSCIFVSTLYLKSSLSCDAYTMTYFAFELRLNNPIGIVFIYLGFGAGLSVFMFCGFIKSIPNEIEEAATIDGCSPLQTFFLIVFPILKPTAITVAILNAMWVWNDYLLPYLVLGSGSSKTLPVAVQMALTGGYGNKDMGALMAMLVLSILPIIIFYLFCQKYIIKGVVAGAVKG